MSVISKRFQKSNGMTLARFDQTMWAPILLGILFFFILSLGAPDSIEGLVMYAAVFMLIVIAVRFKVLRDRIHLPFLALTLYVLMDGISCFYAVSGKFALKEFLKVLLAFMLAVILLATSPKKEEQKGKRIATILAVCTGIGSLVGIDMYSTGWISGAVIWVLKHFTEAYTEIDINFYRMESLFTNANVYAGFSGLGVILSLGLTSSSAQKKERCFNLVLSFLNVVTFILTISLGAFGFCFVALIVFFFFQKPEKRVQTITLMVEVLIISGVVALLIYKMPTHIASVRNLIFATVGAVILCVVDIFVGQRIAVNSFLNIKVTGSVAAVFVVLIIVYFAVALTTTWPITLEPGKNITRMTFPKSGDYTMDVQSDGNALMLEVLSRTRPEDAANTQTIIYSGNAYEASFSVPEDSVVVYFRFSAPEGATITSAQFGRNKVPLEYKLLPSIISQRLGSTFTSNSVSMRLTYFQDGLKLFRRSPIVGLGIGAFENAIKSVQSFYYETKYAHNHYFQTLLETGIVGLILFLFLLISSAVAIWKSRKDQPFAPMFAALWMFMAGQAIHDIVFSAYAYLPLAYGSFAMINLCCGEAIPKPKLNKAVRSVVIAVISVGTVIYCIFVAGNLMAKRNIEKEPSMQMLVQCVNLDRFEWADYALPYVNNAVGEVGKDVSASVRMQADEFAERLAQVNSNTIPIYLAEYYFNTERPEKAIAMLEKYVKYVASDQRCWQSSFNVLRTFDDGSETIRNGVLKLADMMDTWNAENIGTLTMDDDTNAYIAYYRQ